MGVKQRTDGSLCNPDNRERGSRLIQPRWANPRKEKKSANGVQDAKAPAYGVLSRGQYLNGCRVDGQP